MADVPSVSSPSFDCQLRFTTGQTDPVRSASGQTASTCPIAAAQTS